MTVQPQPGMFPARNRIISGLCRAVVIVEAGERSGALITATHAAEQGREVFAVPGPVDSAASAGCLELLRKGAKLVRSADDILEDVRGLAPLDPPKPRQPPASLFENQQGAEVPRPPSVDLDPLQQKVWDFLDAPRHADEIARTLGLSVGELTPVLMRLELKKVVRRLPGNSYERRF
jgi:DNA processing protein